MSRLILGNNKHLSLAERKYIATSLNVGVSFKDTARFICKDPSTVSKEVRLHRADDIHSKRIFNNLHNFFINPVEFTLSHEIYFYKLAKNTGMQPKL